MSRIWASIVIAAGCGNSGTSQPVVTRADPGAGSGSARVSGSGSPAATGSGSGSGSAAVATAGDPAYVTDATGLVEVTPAGTKVIAQDVRWCGADARAQVVWFATDAGLSAFDLVDRQVHPVIKHALVARDAQGVTHGELEVIVDWGKEKLGGEDSLAFDVGVALHMTDKPTTEMVMGCDGDRAVYCFDEHDKPLPAVVALQRLAKKVRIDDSAYVAALAKRGADRSLWTPPPVPPKAPKPPRIDRARCSENADICGRLTAVPGSWLWLVETENSRGDYYHESRELWDPATGEFVRIVGGKLVRSKQPPPENDPDATDYAGLRVSPGGVLSMRGVVFDPKHVIYAPKDEGQTCGFTGGWRIPGPRG